MAFLKGRDGVVKVGTPGEAIGNLQSWNVDTQCDETAGWGMGDSFETSFVTISRWKGSVELYIDPTDPSDALVTGTDVKVEFYPGGEAAGGVYYSGTACISGMNRSGEKAGIPSITINFSGKGALSRTVIS